MHMVAQHVGLTQRRVKFVKFQISDVVSFENKRSVDGIQIVRRLFTDADTH